MSRTHWALILAVFVAPARVLAQPAPPTSATTAPAEPPQPAPPLSRDEPASESERAHDAWKSPAKGVDPPLLPAPSPAGPRTSASGADFGPQEPEGTPPDVAADTDNGSKQEVRIRALEQRVLRDEERIRELEGRAQVWKHFRLESFIQPQLLVQTFNSAASPNVQPDGELPTGIGANDTIAKIDGTTTNGTFFRVRRARLRTFYETEVMRLFLQIDGLPSGGFGPGIGTVLRNAEATGIVRWTRDIRTELTAGLFFTPFRRELLEASLFRPFIERTWFVQNVFPTERDYGFHVKTIAQGDRLVVDLGVVNGQRLGERTFVALPDLNRSKDLFAYATYRLGFVTVGASGYLGRGQIVDTTDLRFKQFPRWALNYEASAHYRLLRAIGESRLSAEFTLAQNMDAGVIYPFAIPKIQANIHEDVGNLEERALYVRFEQDIKRNWSLGYRYDMYTPNSAIKNNARDTHAFLAVWRISPNLRFMSELGWAIDNVHPFGAAPPSKHIVYSSNVLQAMF